MSINKVILIGRLGATPEIRYFEGGGCVARVSLATNEWYKDKRGESHEVTEWHRLTFWNRLAENVEKHLRKGALVYVEGRLTYRTWEDRDKQTHHVAEVVVQRIQYLSGRAAPSLAVVPGEGEAAAELPLLDGEESGPIEPF